MKIRSSKYLLTMIVFCLLLGTFPVILMGIFSYYRSSHTIQEKVNASNMQVLLQTQIGVEQVLKSVDRSLMYFVDSPDVNEAMTLDMKPKDFEKLMGLNIQLGKLQAFDLGVQDVSLMNISKQWIYNNYGFYRLNESDNKTKYEATIGLPQPSMWVSELDFGPDGDLVYSDKFFNEQAVNLIKKIPINSMSPIGIAIAKVPLEFMSKLISRSDGIGEVMILDDHFHVLANNHNHANPQGANLVQAGYIKKIMSENQQTGNFNTKLDDDNVSVIYRKSSYNGWYYVSIMSIEDITKDSKAVGWYLLFICMGILVVISIVSFIGSRKMYNPIFNLYQAIMGSGPTMKVSNEFKFIGEQIQLLVTNQSKMANQIQTQLQQLKVFFTLKLIQGDADQQETEDKLKLYGYPVPPRWMIILVLQIDTTEKTKWSSIDRELTMFAINNIISELLVKECVIHPIIVNDFQVTIIGGEQETYEQFKNDIYTLAEHIQKTVKEYLELQISIGISRTFHEFEHTHRAFNEGVEALKYQIRLGYNVILFNEDVQPGPNMQLLLPVRIQYELIDAVKSIDYDKVKESLHQFMEEVFKLKMSYLEYQIPVARLLTDLVRIVQDSGESYSILFQGQKSLFDQLFELKTAHDIEQWLSNVVIEPIMHMLQDKSENQYKKISGVVLRMIEEEFDTDLTIEECAVRLNYHPSYIRRVFLKEIGENFGEYLTQYRINMAKKWLMDTDMKVLDIANRLRYNNSQNFIRSFRKLEGITPGQYREIRKRRLDGYEN
ncbi:helix-turn-helix domain-containing protein [Paenibacillus sp. WQ 127069]|uniref:Helix-turn-helix domain-containing protein n=1 Tax=Paenibacillus baimaensis TaxID=2982185 RepID=A0ABT2UH30_9BACL|nr:helix-turn-helix domain-containing protein [Paenibacillus sp. WQ 127069]MCU6793197.1 helix-turn-helix domain-containing protein [Paenibacillus sp. WQ 127069]